MGSGPGNALEIYALEGEEDVSTILALDEQSLVILSHATQLEAHHNTIRSSQFRLTTHTVVGQLLEHLEKGHPFQSWKVVASDHVPHDAQTFGPAPYRDFEQDTLNVHDRLVVLSSNWESIRVYSLDVIDVAPFMPSFNLVQDASSLMNALSAAEILFDGLDEDYQAIYFEAYQASGYTQTPLTNIYEIIGLIEGVHQHLEREKQALLSINQAQDEAALWQALLELPDSIKNLDPEAKEAYFKGYVQAGYQSTNTFIAMEEVQGFIDQVNLEFKALQLVLKPLNDALNDTQLHEALIALDGLQHYETLYLEAYDRAYVEVGYRSGQTFKALEAVQAFIDEVNTHVSESLILLNNVNEATDAGSLWAALNDGRLALENLIETHQAHYWQAYIALGYESKLWLFPEALQPFIDQVNQDALDDKSWLDPINQANSTNALHQAFMGVSPSLDDVIEANKEAYWQAYQDQGYHSGQSFISRSELEGFIQGVNEHVQSAPPSQTADLSQLNAAASEDTLWQALSALADAGHITNLIPANKPYYWGGYNHQGYTSKAFESIQEVQGFVDGTNAQAP